MRKNYNLLFFLLFFCNVLFGQNAGDFMSVAPGGNWTSASSWKVYDGNGWQNATQYPGQTPGNYNVIISSRTTVTVATSLAVTIGNVYVQGTLVLDGNFIIQAVNLSAPPKLYVQNGAVRILKNISMTLPAGSNVSMFISDPLTQGIHSKTESDCNNNTAIFIGNDKYSSCNGKGNSSGGEFKDLNAITSTLKAGLTSSKIPAMICKNEIFTLTGTLVATGSIKNGNYALTLASKPEASTFNFNPIIGTIGNDTGWFTHNPGPINYPGQYLFRFTVSVMFQDGTVPMQTFQELLVTVEAPTLWNGKGWSAGAPSTTNKRTAIIDADYTTAVAGNIIACGCIVNTGKQLTVSPNGFLEIENDLVNNGSLNVESDGNLIQKSELGAFEGNSVVVKRNANLKRLDYNYWASPVTGQNLKAFSPETLNKRFYTYNEWNDMFTQVANPAGTNFEANGKGYAVRAPDTYSETPQIFAGTFTGNPNNGALSVRVEKGNTPAGATYTGGGFNLVGNPYPSNINFYQLYEINKDLIYNTAYFWTNVNPNGPMQGSEYPKDGLINNYAVLNGTGGVGATSSSPGTNIPNQYIKVGQGFIVKAKSAGDLLYKNTVRTQDNTGVFFNRMSTGAAQKDRFWLELTTPLQVTTTQLIGYIPEATSGYDPDYDAQLMILGSDAFYSILEEKKLAIQGKGGFSNEDIVPLGAGFYEDGQYTISIGNKEGTFATGQAVYLKDNLTGVVANLSEGPYTFTAQKGYADERFAIVFKLSTALGVKDLPNKKDLYAINEEGNFIVKSAQKKITAIEVYDMKGAILTTVKSANNEVRISNSIWPHGVYVLKVYCGESASVLKVKK